MNQKKIIDIHDGERLSQVFLCRIKKEAVSKTGKSYYALTLTDATGNLEGKVWDINQAIEDFDAGDFIVCDGNVNTFNNVLQLNINRLRLAQKNEYRAEDFFPSTNKDVSEMYADILKFCASIKNPYMKKLVNSFFTDDAEFAEAFKQKSAAKSIHHGFMGGLLEHTLNVVRLCNGYCHIYPQLNRDLLIAAAMLHDVGKVRELSDFPANDYTDEGQLIGHIIIGYAMVSEKIAAIDGFPEKTANELKHCILAHHGELEFGSPKKPALMEAQALHFADNTDAKMEIFIESVVSSTNNGWLGKNPFLDSNVRKTTPLE